MSKKNEQEFNAQIAVEQCVNWIADWFENSSGDADSVIIGISGGLDSAVVANLCINALGNSNNIYGILMTNGNQSDIEDSFIVLEHLNIENNRLIDLNSIGYQINDTFRSCTWYDISDERLKTEVSRAGLEKNTPSFYHNFSTGFDTINTIARLRMMILYSEARKYDGVVSNNTNLSERYIGYTTKGECGDFAPLWNFTKTEVRAIAKFLKLPEAIIDKAPADGLCGETDERSFGFTYGQLDEFIREGSISRVGDQTLEDTLKIELLIKDRHKCTRHKYNEVANFVPNC
jgi:NAD+ synthase